MNDLIEERQRIRDQLQREYWRNLRRETWRVAGVVCDCALLFIATAGWIWGVWHSHADEGTRWALVFGPVMILARLK